MPEIDEKPVTKKAPKPESTSTAAPAHAPAKTKSGDFVVGEIPSPFRPRHLEEIIRRYCESQGIAGTHEAADLDAHRFLKEHGLPNPKKLYRVFAIGRDKDGDDVTLEAREFEAVDETEALSQYCKRDDLTKDRKPIADKAHHYRFKCVLLDY